MAICKEFINYTGENHPLYKKGVAVGKKADSPFGSLLELKQNGAQLDLLDISSRVFLSGYIKALREFMEDGKTNISLDSSLCDLLREKAFLPYFIRGLSDMKSGLQPTIKNGQIIYTKTNDAPREDSVSTSLKNAVFIFGSLVRNAKELQSNF